jgi:hypothetical protein
MNLRDETDRIERTAAQRSVSIRSILRLAGFAPSNWARWKNGKTSPSHKNWDKVTAAADSLFNEAQTASPDSTAGHAGGSSPRPIPGIEQSPPLDARPEQLAETAERGDIAFSSSSPRSTAPVGADQDS